MRVPGIIAILCAAVGGTASAQSSSTDFPRPASLEPAIGFWTRVYTEIDTSSGFIHDSRHLDVVYTTVRAPENSRQRRQITGDARDRYRDILLKLASGKRDGLDKEETRVLALWPADVTNGELREAADRLRFQLGQADRFKAGLIRSGRWKPHILAVLENRNLPRELAVLPHVESSFDPTAYSKVGAAGMWQFTRSTGLRYMTIDHIVDERRDAYLATYAAAQLLADNYAVIQSWPLALTAYNHGLAGMRRAVRQQGTDDIGVIVDNYSSRSFGFASRNFYAAFIAALDVDSNAEKYFGRLDLHKPVDYAEFAAPDYMDAATIARALGVSVDELRLYNPALMETVWAGDKYVPKGFALRVPRSSVAGDPVRLLAAVDTGMRFAAQRPDETHRVRSGETLSGIADQYRVSLATLIRINGLGSGNFIRVGQTIMLPAGAAGVTLAAAEPATRPTDGRYVVRSGDTIDRIARRFGVDEDRLLAANDISNRNRIYVGQTLALPGAGAEPPTPAPALAVAATPVRVAAAEPAADSNLAAADDAPLAVAAVLSPPADEIDEPALQEGATDSDQANLLASTQVDLAADPSDYSVADNQTIEVQALETLGHYADWLELPTQRLRDINGMPFRQAVVLGQRIKLDFSRVTPSLFERRRTSYQRERQESFFSAYQIADIQDHVIKYGESLWILAQRTYNVPVWLLRQYNPDLDLDRVVPGTVVKFPQLRPIDGA